MQLKIVLVFVVYDAVLSGCDNACGSTAVVDCAGVCGGTAVLDCANECNGSAVVDCAGVCGGDAVVGGCDNACGSTAELDYCGECGGDGTSCLTASLTFGTFDSSGGTVEILYDTGAPVAGFQFDVTGLTLTGASGGVAEATGMFASIGGNTVIGYSLSNAEIPAGSGVLTILSFSEIVAGTSELSLGWSGALTNAQGTTLTVTGDSVTFPVDCEGTYFGSAVEDCAGVCGGDAVLSGCDMACGSTATLDECGVCDGPGLNDSGCCGDDLSDCNGTCFDPSLD